MTELPSLSSDNNNCNLDILINEIASLVDTVHDYHTETRSLKEGSLAAVENVLERFEG